jgi:lysyl-tRNA synthetase class 2
VCLAAGFWLLVKDWRDLFPSRRDTTAWQLGLHRYRPALRSFQHLGALPLLAGMTAAAVAIVNIASALTPNIRWRGRLLLQLEPVRAVPLSHALALPAAAALLVCAFYLWRRRRRAWQLALFTLVALGVLDLVKGLDFEEAAASFAAAVLLWWGRDAFRVRHEPISRSSALWRVPLLLGGCVVAVGAFVWLTVPAVSSGLLARETVDLLLWRSGPIVFRDELGELPLAAGLLTLGALLTSAYVVFRPIAAPRALPDARLRRAAAALVRDHGSDTLAFFTLRQDKHYLVSADDRAFLAYRIENGVLLVSGDPIGPSDALADLLQEACVYAEQRGLKVGAVGAGGDLLPLYRDAGLRALYLGDEAIIELDRFSLEGRAIRKIRQSVSRLEKAGYRTSLHTLGSLAPETLREVERVSAAWRKGAPERGFSMAMDSLRGSHQAETVVLIARDADDAARGFLHFVPSYGRPAMSLSFMRRDRDTPNGLTEFMVVSAIEQLRASGMEELSLNFAVFARWLHDPHSVRERMLGKVVALLNPFFQIESLYRFNAKFSPRWEARYLLYEGTLALPRTGLAALWAEGQLPKPPFGVRRAHTVV